MTADEFAAVEQARALLARPAQVSVLRARAFPSGMRMLLRVAAKDEAALQLAAERTGDSPAALHEACVFYVQQLMLDEASDSYRILGVHSSAPIADIKAHYGLLMRWMHPDRNPDAWEVVFAERVNRAWNDLRTVDRRTAYDSAPEGANASTETDAGAEDWVGQAAPFKARPVHATHARAAAVGRREEMQTPAARPLPLRWIGAAGAAGLAAMVLFVAWPQPEADDGPRDISEPGTRLTAQTAENDAALRAASSPATPSASTERVVAQGSTKPPQAALASTPSIRSETVPPARTVPRLVSAPQTAMRLGPTGRQPRFEPDPSNSDAASASVTQVAARTRAPARAEPQAADATMQGTPDAPVASRVAATTVTAPAIAAREVAVEVPDAPAMDAPEPPAKAPDLDQASLLIGRFAHAYQKGDTAALASLFTADATSQGGGIDQIRAAYDRLFARTSERSISIRDIKWRVEDERALATGRFEISQAKDKQDKGSVSRGTIRFDIEQHQDRVLISRLEHIDRGL